MRVTASLYPWVALLLWWFCCHCLFVCFSPIICVLQRSWVLVLELFQLLSTPNKHLTQIPSLQNITFLMFCPIRLKMQPAIHFYCCSKSDAGSAFAILDCWRPEIITQQNFQLLRISQRREKVNPSAYSPKLTEYLVCL